MIIYVSYVCCVCYVMYDYDDYPTQFRYTQRNDTLIYMLYRVTFRRRLFLKLEAVL
jgi:hypothetical protein